MESNDSPEIPDRGETSDIPGLPSGARQEKKSTTKTEKKMCKDTSASTLSGDKMKEDQIRSM